MSKLNARYKILQNTALSNVKEMRIKTLDLSFVEYRLYTPN